MEIFLNIAAYITACSTIIVAMNKLIDNKLRAVYVQMDKYEAKKDDRDRKKIRLQIVSFASSLHRGEKHTREEFEAIFELINIYEEIIEKRNLKNNYFEEELLFIRKCYENLDKMTNL